MTTMTMSRTGSDEEDDEDGDPGENGELRVTAPKYQGQAVPGVYMLFVVD